MHTIKSNARREAWADPQNPFARRNRPQRAQPLQDTESVERRNSDPVITSARRDSNDGPLQFTATDPTAISRRWNNESGDLIGQIPRLDSLENISQEPHLQSIPETHNADSGSISDSSIRFDHPKQPWLALKLERIPQLRVFFSPLLIANAPYILFAFVPAGFAVNYTHQSPRVVFAINFVAIIPSSVVLSAVIDELGKHLGDTFNGLLSMTFSNAVQLITSVLLLRSHQLTILKVSLLGSILSNLLLMTGLGFFVGGIHRIEQYFNVTLAQTICVLLLLAVFSIIIPTVSHLLSNVTPHDVLLQSRGTAVVIMISYGLWLYFQLKTNREMFNPYQDRPKAKVKRIPRGEVNKSIVKSGMQSATVAVGKSVRDMTQQETIEDIEKPLIPIWVGLIVVIISTVLIAFNTDFATNSIQGLLQQANVSPTFIGFVVIPLLSNDPTSIVIARKDNMDLSLALTLERCMQTALMVVPVIVIVAWGLDIDLTLEFDGFSISALFAAMIMVSYVVQEGKSNWLVGALLIKVYVIIALASYFVR